MTTTRRPAAVIWLLLLAVTFGPLLCRTGGDQSWRAAPTAATTALPAAADAPTAPAPRTAATTADADTAPSADADAAGPRADGAPDPAHRLTARTDLVDVPRRCSGRHAPGPDESAPLPAPHRGEPLAPSVAVPVTTAAAPLGRPVPVRSGTGPAGPADPATLLPVLRI
ncbi:hypothetical protein [Streptomyces catenulae]|uniref:Secreted protein n=1 Tax=Streptomyces catenulae TaxID=66875 RepID=A0ABV2YV18_9ACTN|nr:hypothetical protein [Streptomyces catenulae]